MGCCRLISPFIESILLQTMLTPVSPHVRAPIIIMSTPANPLSFVTAPGGWYAPPISRP